MMIHCSTFQYPPDVRPAAFRPALVRFFRRKLRDINDIEDLVQEVFVRIAGRRGDNVENIAGYVFQTAASVLADRHRRRAVRHADEQVPFDSDRHSGTDFDAGRVVEGRDALRAVTAALMNLPERTRRIFLMRRLEGQNYKNIALNFGISVSAVEKQMVRADKHLVTSPGCSPGSAPRGSGAKRPVAAKRHAGAGSRPPCVYLYERRAGHHGGSGQ